MKARGSRRPDRELTRAPATAQSPRAKQASRRWSRCPRATASAVAAQRDLGRGRVGAAPEGVRIGLSPPISRELVMNRHLPLRSVTLVLTLGVAAAATADVV